MAENYVEILVKSRDDAKADLDELRAKLDELSHQVATARAEVDDKEAAAKLDRMQAKLIDLDHKTANPKIRMSGAIRAEAEIHMLEASLDNLKRKEDEAIARVGTQGLISRILNGVAGGGGNAVPSEGLAGTLFGPAGLAIVPAIMALVPEIVALASGFAAAGAGAASFGILAMPAIKHVETAYAALNAAQQKYQAAQAKEAADPTKSNAKALAEAALGLKLAHEQVAKMPQAERDAITGVQGLVAEFGKLSRAFEPQAFKVFADLLQVAHNLLPAVTPFANAFASALDGLLKQAAKFTQSQGFKDWLAQFQKLTGPAVTAIGQGIGKVVVEFGKLLTIFSAKDVVNAINIAFTVLAGTIGALVYAVNRFRQNWDGMVGAFDKSRHTIANTFDTVRHGLADAAHSWAVTFDQIRHTIADFGHNVAAHFDEIRHDIAHWVDNVKSDTSRVIDWFRQLPGRILRAMASLPGQMLAFGRQVVMGFVRGIESMMGSIVSAAEHMIASLGSKVAHLLGIASPSKVAHWWGEMVAQGLAEGIDAGAARAAMAAARMAGGVSSGLAVNPARIPGWGRFFPGGAAGGGAPVVNIQPVPGGSGLDQMFMTWLQNAVRQRGGDPAVFTRKVAFQ